jgi:hypothetical protein
MTVESPKQLSASSNSVLSPPHSLRKSVSVDSFVRLAHEPDKSTTRQTRGHTTVDAPSQIIVDHLNLTQSSHMGRSRGESISSGYASSNHNDSDDLNSSELSLSRNLKPSAINHPSLTSFSPTSTSTPSMTSLDGSTSSSTHGVGHAFVASTQPGSRRVPHITTSAAGRARSGSLGVYNQNVVHRVNTQAYSVSAI